MFAQSLNAAELVANSPVMQNVLRKACEIARTHFHVFLYGERGTGKTSIAKFIHNESPRKGCEFREENCACLTEELVQSILFGHKRGAFTGAWTKKTGVFKLAHNGTVFLDEIARLPAAAQNSLLRVVQDGRFCPVGEEKEESVDVRVIAATWEDIDALADQDKFNRPLLDRLSKLTLEIPPLRERREDIEGLLSYFLRRLAARACRREVPSLAPGAIKICQQYTWPGNVREVENVVAKLLTHTKESVISEESVMALLCPPKKNAGGQFSSSGSHLSTEAGPLGKDWSSADALLLAEDGCRAEFDVVTVLALRHLMKTADSKFAPDSAKGFRRIDLAVAIHEIATKTRPALRAIIDEKAPSDPENFGILQQYLRTHGHRKDCDSIFDVLTRSLQRLIGYGIVEVHQRETGHRSYHVTSKFRVL